MLRLSTVKLLRLTLKFLLSETEIKVSTEIELIQLRHSKEETIRDRQLMG